MRSLHRARRQNLIGKGGRSKTDFILFHLELWTEAEIVRPKLTNDK